MVMAGACDMSHVNRVTVVMAGACDMSHLNRVTVVMAGACDMSHLNRVTVVMAGACDMSHFNRVTVVMAGACDMSHLNRVTVVQSIQPEGPAQVHTDKLCPHIVLREAVVHTQVLNPRGKAFFQPQVGPPVLEQKSPPSTIVMNGNSTTRETQNHNQ